MTRILRVTQHSPRRMHTMLESTIPTPALMLDMDAFEKNMHCLQEFADSRGIALRPHFKSHKCTAIAHMQVKNGAKGVCCAKLGEAEDLAAAGIEDILLANQVVDRAKIARVASLADCCRFTICVDHAGNVDDLSAAAVGQGVTIHCLVEYNIGMNRCGVCNYEDFFALAKRIHEAPNLRFEGIQAYAGQLSHLEDYDSRKAGTEKYERDLAGLKQYVEERGIPVREVSGVSTGTAHLRPPTSVYTEMQAGSYIFMDAAYDALALPFENALFVLTSILNTGNGRIITDCGMKSVSSDQKMPRVREYPASPVKLSEEHCSFPAASKHGINDRLHLIPGHCCTTVNLHDWIYFVRKGKVEDRVPVTSRGKAY